VQGPEGEKYTAIVRQTVIVEGDRQSRAELRTYYGDLTHPIETRTSYQLIRRTMGTLEVPLVLEGRLGTLDSNRNCPVTATEHPWE
jgi:hypothetical protein